MGDLSMEASRFVAHTGMLHADQLFGTARPTVVRTQFVPSACAPA
jgi:hypothetical protein